MNRYSDEELEFIQVNVKTPEKVLVQMFNETFEQKINVGILGNLKNKLGVKSGLTGGRFEKGHVPATKGLKWDEFMSKKGQANSRKTTFKKGHVPANARPLGSERMDLNGYLMIKVAEPNKFVLKHKWLWEQHFGVIPSGYILTFLDGNPLNCELSNLKLISKSQNLILNRKKLRFKNSELNQSAIEVARVIESCNRRRNEHI